VTSGRVALLLGCYPRQLQPTKPAKFSGTRNDIVGCSFYAIAAPLRFYTTKTQKQTSNVPIKETILEHGLVGAPALIE
jgi:hypothetical protein